MANTRTENVWFIDTDNTVIDLPITIKSIKYIGAAASAVSIKTGSTSGAVLWTESATTNVFDGEVCIRAKSPIHIDITGTAAIYLYLE